MLKKLLIQFCFYVILVSNISGQDNYFLNTTYLSGGVWFPTGKLKTLGNHPFIGISYGEQKNRFLYNFVFDVRFLNSKNYYKFKYQDSIHITKFFFGGYLGFDIGYEIIKFKNSSFNIIGGLGYDSFDALFPEALKNNKASTHSYNLNFGILYKYYFKDFKYIGIQSKFNLIDNTLQKRTDLTGNAFTIAVLYCLAKD